MSMKLQFLCNAQKSIGVTALFEFYKYILILLQIFQFVTHKSFLAGKIIPNTQSQLANSDHKAAIQTLLSEIETDFEHIPSLEEAATQTGLSKFYFARHFRNCTGHTYWDYINQIRLKKASQLLIETNDAICKIALACGFHDLSSFNRSFKKEIGCTPSAYRKQILSN